MKTFILLTLGAIFLGFSITMTNGHSKPICPKIGVQGNLSDPAVFDAIQLNIVERLWNQTFPTLTPHTIEFKEVILKMARSDVPKFRYMAFLVSIYGWSAAPFIAQNPDLCAYAQIINQTIDWQTNRNCTAQFLAIDRLTTSILERSNMMVSTAINSAGCGVRNIVPEQYKCYANGTVYKYDKVWTLRGYQYPCELQKTALKLYRSKKPIDQLFGAMATSGLTDFPAGFVNNFPGNIILQFFTYRLAPKIPRHCCKQFIAETESIGHSVYTNSQNATAGSKAMYPECFKTKSNRK